MLGVIFVEVSDVRAVAVPPGLERSPSQPSVSLLNTSICPGDLTPVDHALHLPLSVHHTPQAKDNVCAGPGSYSEVGGAGQQQQDLSESYYCDC